MNTRVLAGCAEIGCKREAHIRIVTFYDELDGDAGAIAYLCPVHAVTYSHEVAADGGVRVVTERL